MPDIYNASHYHNKTTTTVVEKWNPLLSRWFQHLPNSNGLRNQIKQQPLFKLQLLTNLVPDSRFIEQLNIMYHNKTLNNEKKTNFRSDIIRSLGSNGSKDNARVNRPAR
jgi:hypothetical protein